MSNTDNMNSVPVELSEVVQDICDNYCMFPNEYLSQYHDPDDAFEAMHREVCDKCPTRKLL